jgi:hypothetical protein
MARAHLVGVALAATLALDVAPARAQIAPGSQLRFAGTTDAVDIGAAGLSLDFTGDAITAAAGTGAFAGLLTGTAGTIRDVTVGTGPNPVAGFVTIGGYTFDLLGMPEGTFDQSVCYVYPEPGQTCTPLQAPAPNPSPFNVTNYATDDAEAPIRSVAAFDVWGTVTGPGGVRSAFVGTISAEFPGLSYQEALGTVEAVGLQGVRYTGVFTTVSTVPEPSTFVLLAGGLLGTLALARRRRTPRAVEARCRR